jgi:hypothetical protein
MKVYELEGDVERYQIIIKNQEEKILKFNQDLQQKKDSEQIVKRLTE